MRIIKAGATSQSIYLEILDSTSTSGARKTGLAFNTSSLTAYYVQNGGSATAITLATLAAANSAWSSGGFKEVDATNMPGVYRLDVPNAALTGAVSVVITLKGATGMVQESVEILLVAYDPQDAVRQGMTALPNAAAEAAGGLYTRGSGAGQINQPANGQIDANAVKLGGTTQTGRDIGASVLLSSGTGTGQLDFTSGVVKANLAQILGTVLTETAGQIAAGFKKLFDVASPTGTLNSLPGAVPGASGGLPTTDASNAVKVQSGTGANQISLSSGAVLLQATQTGVTIPTVTNVTNGVSLAAKDSMAVRNATAQAGAASTITLDAGASATDSLYVGQMVKIDSGTGAGQARTITGYVGSTKVATVDRAWQTNPDNTSVFTLVATDEAALNSSLQPVAASVAGAVASVTGNVGGNVVGSVGSVSGAVASVTGNVGGNVNGSVGSIATGGIAAASFAAGAIDNAAIATDAIGSAELAASAATEIATAVRDIDNTSPAALSLGAKVNSAASAGDPLATSVPGAYSAGTAGYLIGNNLNASIAAVKAKTDNLPASPAAVGSAMTLATNAITAAVIATDAIDADALASDGVAEIQSGLSTLNAAGVRTAVGLASANLDTQLSGINSKTTNLPGSPAAVGSPMTLANGAITAAVVATDAIDADAISSDAVTEITSGLSTLNAAGVRTAVGLASANLDTQLGAIAGYVDTEVAAVKVVTDKLSTMLNGTPQFTSTALALAPGAGSAPTALEVATQVNTTLSGAHGSGAWGPAGASGAFTVPIRVRDANTAANLAGVLVSVYDSTGATLRDQKRTDSTGIATFSLDAATYTVRVTPQAGYGSLADQSLTVTGNTATVGYTLAPLSIPNATPADTVTYYGYEFLLDGVTPNSGARIVVTLTSTQPASSGTALLERGPQVYRADDTGLWSAALVRGKQYQVTIAASGVSKTFTVPSDTGVTAINIKDVA